MSTDDERLANVLLAHPLVLSAWVFGSVVQGWARPDSDLDLGVLATRSLAAAEVADLQIELDRAIDSDRVDLVLLNEASPILRFEAVSGRRLVSKDPEAEAAFVSWTGREYEESLNRIAAARAERHPGG